MKKLKTSLSANVIKKIDDTLGTQGVPHISLLWQIWKEEGEQVSRLPDYIDERTLEVAKNCYFWNIHPLTSEPKSNSMQYLMNDSMEFMMDDEGLSVNSTFFAQGKADQMTKEVRQLLIDDPVTVYKIVEVIDQGQTNLRGIVVAPTTDQFDVLKIEMVAGPNRKIYTDKIIEELMRLDEQYGIDITGANEFSLELSLARTPTTQEMRELGQWLHEFCADIYFEPPSSLMNERIVFWWD